MGPEEPHRHVATRMTESYEVGIELPWDLHRDLITVAQAAELVFGWTDNRKQRRRYEAVVHGWIRRKHIPIQDRGGPRGSPRIFGIDALRAERDTRERARRTA